MPPLILTCADGRRRHPQRLGSVAEVLDASGPDPAAVDAATALKILADRGLFRVLTEGGPPLLGPLIEARPARRAVPDHRAACWSAAWRPRIATGPGEVHTGCGAATC